MRMVWGSLIAYWLSGIINPAFVAIAVMIALFIPILINEYTAFESDNQPDTKPQPKKPKQSSRSEPKQAKLPSTQRLMDESK